MTLNTTAGDPAADSYASVADADAYFTARGNTSWSAAITGDKEIALRKATAYLDNQYARYWCGVRTNVTQSLAWPRSDGTRNPYGYSFLYPLLDTDGVPVSTTAVPDAIKTACVEAATLALSGTALEPTLVRGGQIKSQTKTVGPLSKSTTYADGAPTVDRYTAIEGLLFGLVKGTPGGNNGIMPMVRG